MEEIIIAVYYLSALVLASFIIKTYRKDTAISKKLAIAMLMNFLMILAYTLNISAVMEFTKSLGCSISFVLMDLMLYCYYDYVLAYIGWRNRAAKWLKYIFMTYAVVDAIFMLVNPFMEITLSYRKAPFAEGYVLTYVPLLPFHVHIAYNFIMIIATIVLLLRKCKEAPKVYLNRYYGPIFGMVLSIAIYFVYLAGYIPLSVDPTLLLYVLVGLILYFYTFNYLPGVTIEITRNMILQYMKDPIILFDYEGKLVAYSDQMKELMPDFTFKDDVTIEQFVKENGFSGLNGTNLNQEIDWIYQENGITRIYQCQLNCMKDDEQKLVGKLFMFHDITSIRQTFFEFEHSMLFDSVTGFYNKQSFMTQIPQWNIPEYWPVSVAVCNVDGMNAINEAYGTAFGDAAMRNIARYIRRRVGDKVFCAKIDNGDIVIVLEGTSNGDAATLLEAIEMDISDFYENMPVSIEFGVATKEDTELSIEKTLQNARASMQKKKMLKDKSASSSLVDSLKQTLCESDFQTEEHVERTREMAARLGREMGISDSDIGRLELLAVLHDIGKVAIPQDIIKKQGKLTPEERAIIEQHTVKGYRIAKSSAELEDIAEGILSHHEKWDGTGYPNRLKGEEIPLIARIISAVDSHDVMVNDRPYHKAMPEADAIAELKRCSGTQFDPQVVEIFVKLLEREELPKEQEKEEAAPVKLQEAVANA